MEIPVFGERVCACRHILMKKKASTLRCREDCPTKVHSEGTVFGVTAEILLSLDTATGVHTHHLFLVSLKIHRMASNSNANNCALCSKQVFLFERRVKTKDLEEQELAALMLIRKNSDFPKLLETNQSILCMSCCRKVKASNENGQQGGEYCTRQLLFIHWYDIR